MFPVTELALVCLSGRLPETNVSNIVSTANGVSLDYDGVKPPECPSKSLPTNVSTVPNGEVQTGECANLFGGLIAKLFGAYHLSRIIQDFLKKILNRVREYVRKFNSSGRYNILLHFDIFLGIVFPEVSVLDLLSDDRPRNDFGGGSVPEPHVAFSVEGIFSSFS